MDIFSGKNVIQVREKIFRPPKLGARSPPLLIFLQIDVETWIEYFPISRRHPARRSDGPLEFCIALQPILSELKSELRVALLHDLTLGARYRRGGARCSAYRPGGSQSWA